MQPSVIEVKVEEKLAGQQIPVLPAGAPRLLKNLSDEEIDYASLVATLELFPSIVGRLIALANSPWSAPTEEITSLQRACTRLGFAVVKSTSIAMAIASPFDRNRCPEFDAHHYWLHAFMTAEAAELLYDVMPEELRHDVATLRTAGLLHNLGTLLLADRLPEVMGKAIQQEQNDDGVPIREALFNELGFDDTHAGLYLGKCWALPPIFVKMLANYADQDYNGIYWEEVNVTGLASAVVSDLLSETQRALEDKRLQKLDVTTDNVQDIYAKLSAKQEQIQGLVSELFGQ